jgi:hypothetical protein
VTRFRDTLGSSTDLLGGGTAMPVHDWTRVDAGLFHDFHQGWTVALRNALNAGMLPSDQEGASRL